MMSNFNKNDLFFADVAACECGNKLSMIDLIGFVEGTHVITCPNCKSQYNVYSNLEVEYTIMPSGNLSMCSILGLANKEN